MYDQDTKRVADLRAIADEIVAKGAGRVPDHSIVGLLRDAADRIVAINAEIERANHPAFVGVT